MGYSSLATKIIISPNYNKRNRDIDSVSIHCSCGVISLDSMGEIYKDPKRKSSANYGIDNNGNIAMFVDEKNASICTSNTTVDARSITIMVSAQTNQSPYHITEAAYKALQDLLVDICIRNNIKELKWADDEKYAKAAAAGGPVDKQNMFIHSWFSKKQDPGEYLHEKHPELVQLTNTQLVIDRDNMRRICFIGDDRAAQIHDVIGSDLNLWFTKNKPTCNWTGYKLLPFASEINNKSAVCIFGGATDPNYTKAKDYAEKINEYAKKWISAGCAVYYVSITPVSRTGHGNMTNAKIQKFNEAMQKNLMVGVGYIDAYNDIINNFIVTDGYHYDDNTCKEIYSTVIKQASRLTGGIRLNLNISLNPTDFHPYIVTFARDAKVNYKALSDLRVVGAIIEAGYRFDSSGKRTKQFDNPNIETQIESLDKFEIPYGMYTICRAKTTEDAKTEMQYFRYQLYRHPPKWGAWLQLTNLNSLKAVNDKVLEQYNKSLTEFGFSSRMGIMCTRKDLEKISWDKWQDQFYLYLIDHLQDLTSLDNLLDPQLFDIDGTEPTILIPSVTSNTLLLSTGTATSSQLPSSLLSTTQTRKDMITYAFTFLGSPYVLGASGMKPGEATDCGQFVCAVYYHFGMDLRSHRTSITQSYGKQVSLSEAKPGDVVHWPYNPKYSNAHVAIYIGDNQIIEATTSGKSNGVQVSSLGDRYDRIVNIIDNWKG